MILAARGFSIAHIGIITSVYPAVWGIGQIITGKLADRFCKKNMLFWGMTLQAMAILGLVLASSFSEFVLLSVLLGWGTAMVYPTFLASIAENTHPADRPKSLGIFRFWRDLGYAIGAIITGLLADAFNLEASLFFVGGLTLASGIIIYFRMKCPSFNLNITGRMKKFRRLGSNPLIRQLKTLRFTHQT
jgi:MFS family permease